MYNFYLAGKGPANCEEYKRVSGCCQLLSQLNDRKHISEWIEYLKAHPKSDSNLFIDSGAFSVYCSGKKVDVDEYISYINSISKYVTVFAQVDEIPGEYGKEPSIKQYMDAPKKSWDNYLYMLPKVKEPKKLVPIFHQGESFKWLENMLNFKYSDGSYIDYIGLSPVFPLVKAEVVPWLEECFGIIQKSSNPEVKTHAFGLGAFKVIDMFNLTSSDSTTWIKEAVYGRVLLPDKTIHVGNEVTMSEVSTKDMAYIDMICKKMGVDKHTLISDTKTRQLFNLYSVKHWADNRVSKTHNIVLKKSIW